MDGAETTCRGIFTGHLSKYKIRSKEIRSPGSYVSFDVIIIFYTDDDDDVEGSNTNVNHVILLHEEKTYLIESAAAPSPFDLQPA